MEILYLHALSLALYILLVLRMLITRQQASPTFWFAILCTVFWLSQTISNNLHLDNYSQNYYSWVFSQFGWLVFLQTFYLKIPGISDSKWLSVYAVNVALILLLVLSLAQEPASSDLSRPVKLLSYTAMIMAITMMFYLENIIRCLKSGSRYIYKHMLFGLAIYALVNLLNFYAIAIKQEFDFLIYYLALFIHVSLPVFMWISLGRSPVASADDFDKREFGSVQYILVVIGGSLVVAGLLRLLDLYFSQVRSDFYQALFLVTLISSLGVLLLSSFFRTEITLYFRAYFHGDKNDYQKEWKTVSLICQDEGNIYDNILDYFLKQFDCTVGALYLCHDSDLQLTVSRGQVSSNLSVSRGAESIAREPLSSKINLIRGEGGPVVQVQMQVGARLISVCSIELNEVSPHYETSWLNLLDMVSDEFAIRLNEIAQLQRISRQEKLMAFNRTVAFLAHDLKNISAQQTLAIQNYDHFKDDPEFLADFRDTFGHTTKKLNDLIGQFRYKSLNSPKKLVNLPDILQHLEKAARMASEKVIVNHHDVEVDSSTMFHADVLTVLDNLIKNALEASGNRDKVRVNLDLNDQLNISVIDQGKGMSKQFIEGELFEPFSSKEKENGLGIGMYHVKSILDELNASIEIESTPGEGTRVDISVPSYSPK